MDLQTHTLILWAHPNNESFKSTIERAYSVLVLLRDFGDELSPNFLTVKSKADAKPFDVKLENLENVIRKGVNKEGGSNFPELGYRISFFSSLDDKNSAKISLTIGTSNPQLKNSLVINFPQNFHLYQDEALREKVMKLFKELSSVFNPYWGCIQNDVNANRLDVLWDKSLPTSIHWANFFGFDIVNLLGVARVQSAPISEVLKASAGYFIKLKDTPIDDNDIRDVKLQESINVYFGF